MSPGGDRRKRGAFRRIVTAPVRLFAGHLQASATRIRWRFATRVASDIDGMKIIPMQRTKSSAEMMADHRSAGRRRGDGLLIERRRACLTMPSTSMTRVGSMRRSRSWSAATVAHRPLLPRPTICLGSATIQKRQYSVGAAGV
jgi:hypothetical protein